MKPTKRQNSWTKGQGLAEYAIILLIVAVVIYFVILGLANITQLDGLRSYLGKPVREFNLTDMFTLIILFKIICIDPLVAATKDNKPTN